MKKSEARRASASRVNLKRRMLEVRRLDFARAILSALKLPDTRGIDIEARDCKTFARKGDRDGQPDITQSDNCDLPRK